MFEEDKVVVLGNEGQDDNGQADQIDVINLEVKQDISPRINIQPISLSVYENGYYESYWEVLDSSKLDLLLTNKNKIRKDVIGTLKKMKKWSLNRESGTRKKKVVYNQKYGGRMYPKDESLVYLPSNYRNFLCADLYYDLDIVNSMPSVLINKCKEDGIKFCETLTHYVNHREESLAKISKKLKISRDVAKDLVLKAVFGAGEYMLEEALEDDVPKEVLAIKNEVSQIRSVLVHDKKYEMFLKQVKKDAPKNKLKTYWDGSYLSFILAKTENDILKCMMNFLKKDGYHISFPEFDGMKIKRKEGGLPTEKILECEQYIKDQLGMDIKLKIKSMETDIYFDDEDDKFNDPIYLKIKEKFEKNNFKVTHNPSCYVTEDINQDDKPILIKKREVDFKFANNELRLDEKPFLDTWADDPNKRMYKAIDFIPYDCPDDIYNMFKGFKSNITDDPVNIDLIKDHYLALCESRQDVLHKFFSMIACKIREPLVNIPIFMVFFGKKGCGKNIGIDFIGEIIGSEYYTTDTLSQILDQYGDDREHKLLINVDELNIREGIRFEEQIKRMITATHVKIEEKYIPKSSIRNLALYIGTTNNENCLSLKAGDRRPKVYKCDPKFKGNAAYFEELAGLMKRDDVKDSFFTFLWNYPYDRKKVIDETSYPDSQIQIDMKIRNVPKIYVFLKSCYIDQYTARFWKLSSCIYDDYIKFIEKNFRRNQPMTITSFGIKLKEIFGDVKDSKKPNQHVGKKKTTKGLQYLIYKKKFNEHLEEEGIILGD